VEEGPRTKREKPKKAASLTMRLTQRTRTALENAASAEGRSISEMAERWLDMAAQGKADVEARSGGGAMGEAMLTMAAFANALTDDVAAVHPELAGVDPTNDLGVRAALVSGIGRLFALIYPIRGHGASTPDPQPSRHQLQRACVICRNELGRVAAPAGAPNDLEAAAILDRCGIGDLTEASLETLRAALVRASNLGDANFKASVEAVTAALAEYDDARARELTALARWSAQGRILAETIAGGELAHQMHAQARLLQERMPGTPFATGAVRQAGVISDQALFEREQALEELAQKF